MTDSTEHSADDEFSSLAKESLWESSFYTLRARAFFFDCLELKPVRDGLDVGCGTGFPLIELAAVHGPGSRWTGLEESTEAIRRVRRKIELLGLKSVTLEELDASHETFPFAADSFDLITSHFGINGFCDSEAAVSECFRVARRRARIVLCVNSVVGYMSEMFDLLRRAARDLGLPPGIRETLDHFERTLESKESITRLLRNSGFKVQKHAVRKFHLTCVNGTAMVHHPVVKEFMNWWRHRAVGSKYEDDLLAEVERRLNKRSTVQFTLPALYVEGMRS